jgi:predicted DCC family thiol-disulfide oxidoreductase YuxK
MSTGWTGGQYSLFRAGFGIWLAGSFAALVPAPSSFAVLLGLVGAIAGLCFAAGVMDRAAGLVLLALRVAFTISAGTAVDVATVVTVIVLLTHLLLPPAPYGSLAARHRTDPGAGWRFPPWLGELVWVALIVLLMWRAASVRATPAGLIAQPLSLLSATLLLVGLLSSRLRPVMWLAAVAVETVLLLWHPSLSGDGALFWLLLLACDPAWIPGTSGSGSALGGDLVFYDGNCGLCHRYVRFLLAEDRGEGIRFSPLNSGIFLGRVAEKDRAGLPDSVVLLRGDGRLLCRSDAVLYLAGRLGGFWRGAGMVGALLPAGMRDAAYDAVARVRLRLFARPAEACPLVPPALLARFEH